MLFESANPLAATGRDAIPGTILQLLKEQTMKRLSPAKLGRSGRPPPAKEMRHRVAVFHRKPISLAPSLYKLFEVCKWKMLDKELVPLPDQLYGLR